MGGETTPSRAIVQSAGYAYRLTGNRLKQEFNRHGEMLHVLLRYTQSLITQMAQTAVCNRHHSVDQQLCRWLLLSLDRLAGNQLQMTQELIANMLGVRREGVTEAAGKLQKLGVIRYVRGKITVLDRPQLERLSCECYAVVKRETDRLLAASPTGSGTIAVDTSQGSLIVNSLPRFSPALAAATVPPCASTKQTREIELRALPGFGRPGSALRGLADCIGSRCAAGMPVPMSLIMIETRAPLRCARTWMWPCLWAYWQAFAMRLCNAWHSRNTSICR